MDVTMRATPMTPTCVSVQSGQHSQDSTVTKLQSPTLAPCYAAQKASAAHQDTSKNAQDCP